jgi:hypothetical protein
MLKIAIDNGNCNTALYFMNRVQQPHRFTNDFLKVLGKFPLHLPILESWIKALFPTALATFSNSRIPLALQRANNMLISINPVGLDFFSIWKEMLQIYFYTGRLDKATSWLKYGFLCKGFDIFDLLDLILIIPHYSTETRYFYLALAHLVFQFSTVTTVNDGFLPILTQLYYMIYSHQDHKKLNAVAAIIFTLEPDAPAAENFELYNQLPTKDTHLPVYIFEQLIQKFSDPLMINNILAIQHSKNHLLDLQRILIQSGHAKYVYILWKFAFENNCPNSYNLLVDYLKHFSGTSSEFISIREITSLMKSSGMDKLSDAYLHWIKYSVENLDFSYCREILYIYEKNSKIYHFNSEDIKEAFASLAIALRKENKPADLLSFFYLSCQMKHNSLDMIFSELLQIHPQAQESDIVFSILANLKMLPGPNFCKHILSCMLGKPLATIETYNRLKSLGMVPNVDIFLVMLDSALNRHKYQQTGLQDLGKWRKYLEFVRAEMKRHRVFSQEPRILNKLFLLDLELTKSKQSPIFFKYWRLVVSGIFIPDRKSWRLLMDTVVKLTTNQLLTYDVWNRGLKANIEWDESDRNIVLKRLCRINNFSAVQDTLKAYCTQNIKEKWLPRAYKDVILSKTLLEKNLLP